MKTVSFEQAKRSLVKRDPQLKELFKRHKISFSPQLKREPAESLIIAVANQQLHSKAAQTILNRLFELFPHKKFPTAKEILSLRESDLRSCGFSNSKVRSILDIATKAESGFIPSKKEIKKMSNEEIVERLTDIFGVGRWTVEMLLIFQLGRLDIWPVDDFGVRKGFQVWKKKREMPTAKQMLVYGKKWPEFQTVIALYLWREADLRKEKNKT